MDKNEKESDTQHAFRELSENLQHFWLAVVNEYVKTPIGKLTVRFLDWMERVLNG